MNMNIQLAGSVSSFAPAATAAAVASYRPEKTPALKFLLVYEDSETGLRAKKIMNRLVAPRADGMDSKPVLFRFELLSMREIWELAATESQAVNMLVLSAHSSISVPTEVKSWITYWLGLKGGLPRQVIASFDAGAHPTTDGDLTLFFLRSLAAWAHVELTTLFGEDPLVESNQPLNRLLPLTNQDRSKGPSFLAQDRTAHARRRWGLNE